MKQPFGLGPGVAATRDELAAAKEALASRGVARTSDYVNIYMFEGHVELHSIASDMWVNFGFVGLLTALFISIGLVRGILKKIAFPPRAALIFIGVSALWDVLFSPFPSAALTTVLAYCVLQFQRTDSEPS